MGSKGIGGILIGDKHSLTLIGPSDNLPYRELDSE